MSQLRKSSLLFDKVRQGANTVAAKSNKSSFVYEADKTWTQRLLDKNVKKLQENQKFYSVNDGVPMWWKSKSGKFLTTLSVVSTVSLFVISLSNCYKFANGKL